MKDTTIAHNREQLVKALSHNEDFQLSKLESISQSYLNQLNEKFNFDNDDFELDDILKSFIALSSNQNIHSRSAGITLEDTNVHGVDERFAVLPTVSQLINFPLTLLQKMRPGPIPTRKILHNINCLAKPGDMVLVLGRPGAGCSSLLKTISGTDLQLFAKVDGTIEYDGINQSKFLQHFKNELIYNPEFDVHFPHLTVEQTLRFAIACKTPNIRVNNVSRELFIDKMTLVLATVFGLRQVLKSKVGNEYIRGISGGQRKRVSIAEALACRGSIYCWDNATRGLDSSTALEYAEAIRSVTSLMTTTSFVTLYQAGENVYQTFDKVTVLYNGRQIYFGPIHEAKAYFVNMGWECPPRQTTAEFLTAVTDPNGRFKSPNFKNNKIPHTDLEFEEYWLNSPQYQTLKNDIFEYKQQHSPQNTTKLLTKSLQQEKQRYARDKSSYTINYSQQLQLATRRAWDRVWGDKYYTVTFVVSTIVQGFIVGSSFYNTPDDITGAFSRGGSLFFLALYVTLMGIAEVSASFTNRAILMKQKNYSLYHLSTDALATFVLNIPVSFVAVSLFVLVLYFLANLARDVGKFFTVALFVFLLQLIMVTLFRAICSFTATASAANSIVGIGILCCFTYSSFIIQWPSMHPWFKWISYLNPIYYAFEAMITTEFHGRNMECIGSYLIPSGNGYENVLGGEQACAFVGSVLGQSWVSGDNYLELAYSYKFSHVWRNFGILVGMLIGLLCINCLGVEFIRPVKGGADRLIFLGDRVPDAVVLPTKGDLESNTVDSVSIDIESDNQQPMFKDLESKDVFVWQNVTYTIEYDGSERILLDDVSGYCVPGTLTALMGESGAGKTTLLNTLAQRIDMGVVTGDMLVNGNHLDESFMRRTGYVMQQDIHVNESTVREALQFAARLRRSNSVPDSEKLEYVETIIKVLGMEPYANAMVGQQGSGLNVEQRKKLSIAVELVAKPSLLLFLDEPTSGLDSQSSWAIVKMLRDLANAGQSILCTIHQPSATLFEEFDRLLLLRKGGQTVYFGKIGENSKIMLDYFESNGGRKCESAENPAEYMLETIGAGATASAEFDWFEKWSNSPQKLESEEEGRQLLEEYCHKAMDLDEKVSKELRQTYAVPYWYQFKSVLVRTAHVFYRDIDYAIARLIFQTFSGLFLGFTFFNLEYTMTGAQNGMFVSFLCVVICAPIINLIMTKAISGRELFETREKKSRTYHWSLMILTQFLTEIPYMLFGSAVFFVSIYFPTKAETDGGHAGMFYVTYGIFLQLFVISFGLLIIYQFPDLETSGVIFSFVYTLIVSFTGVVQPVGLMPGFWKFMWRASPYTYVINNLVSSFLHGRSIRCAPNELAIFNVPLGETCGRYMSAFLESNGGYLDDPTSTTSCGYCKFDNADQYLASLGFNYSNINRNFGLFVVFIAFNLLLCCLLYWIFRFRKWGKK